MSRSQIPSTVFDFQIIYLSGYGYAVEDKNGNRLTDFTLMRPQAVQWRADLQRQADARAKRGLRACLCCGRDFQSDGIHNRLCDYCRRGSAEAAPHGLAIPRRTRAA